jgi:hypothetical protein
MTSCSIHAATTDVESIITRLVTQCSSFGTDTFIEESGMLFSFELFGFFAAHFYLPFLVYRTLPSTNVEASELRVCKNKIDNETYVVFDCFFFCWQDS